MEFENSPLSREVKAIQRSGAKRVHFSYVAEVHVGERTFRSTKVIFVHRYEDFETCFSEILNVQLDFTAGVFFTEIFPNRDNLEVTLKQVPIGEMETNVSMDSTVRFERYLAYVEKSIRSPLKENTTVGPSDANIMDLSAIVTIPFQLVNKIITQVRMKATGRVYRNETMESIIKTTLTNRVTELSIGTDRQIRGVDMIAPDNQAVQDHVIVDQKITLCDFPGYLQEHCGGVYATDIGSYIRDDIWYIYPKYNIKIWDTSENQMTIVVVPKYKYPNLERTYRVDGSNIVLLSTGGSSEDRSTELTSLQTGTGVRFSNADDFMSGVETRDNKLVVSRAERNSEFAGKAVRDEDTFAMVAPSMITANIFNEMSKLSRNNGIVNRYLWENSDITVLKPGMAVRTLELINNEIVETKGILLAANTRGDMKGTGYMTTGYTSTTELSVFMEKTIL